MTYDEHAYTYDVVVTDNAMASWWLLLKTCRAVPPSPTPTRPTSRARPWARWDDLATSIGGTLVGVGDELTYTINWVNNVLDPKRARAWWPT